MRDMKKIYFAHPFECWKTKREKMIIDILINRGYEVYNPFEKEISLNKKYNVKYYYQNPTKSHASDIVSICFKNVMECDSYFGWFPKNIQMIGTPIEMGWAYHAELLRYKMKKKEIIVLCHQIHPFCWEYSDKLYIGYKNFKENKVFDHPPVS